MNKLLEQILTETFNKYLNIERDRAYLDGVKRGRSDRNLELAIEKEMKEKKD